MNGYLTDDEIRCCKHVTYVEDKDGCSVPACTLEGSDLPCETVLRCSDGCKWEKYEEKKEEPYEDNWFVVCEISKEEYDRVGGLAHKLVPKDIDILSCEIKKIDGKYFLKYWLE
jgi:hypothetical protein